MGSPCLACVTVTALIYLGAGIDLRPRRPADFSHDSESLAPFPTPQNKQNTRELPWQVVWAIHITPLFLLQGGRALGTCWCQVEPLGDASHCVSSLACMLPSTAAYSPHQSNNTFLFLISCCIEEFMTLVDLLSVFLCTMYRIHIPLEIISISFQRGWSKLIWQFGGWSRRGSSYVESLYGVSAFIEARPLFLSFWLRSQEEDLCEMLWRKRPNHNLVSKKPSWNYIDVVVNVQKHFHYSITGCKWIYLSLWQINKVTCYVHHH